MKMAVMSDSHDSLGNIEEAVRFINEQGIKVLIHCGDLCSPFVMERLAKFGGDVHVVFGNNDGDPYMIMKMARNHSNIIIHGHIGSIDTEYGLVAFTHHPECGRGLASTGDYAAVFSGHTHRSKKEDIGGTAHLNPGEIMGLKENPGCIIYDIKEGTSERIELAS
jgi:putative phosphoesterase